MGRRTGRTRTAMTGRRGTGGKEGGAPVSGMPLALDKEAIYKAYHKGTVSSKKRKQVRPCLLPLAPCSTALSCTPLLCPILHRQQVSLCSLSACSCRVCTGEAKARPVRPEEEAARPERVPGRRGRADGGHLRGPGQLIHDPQGFADKLSRACAPATSASRSR